MEKLNVLEIIFLVWVGSGYLAGLIDAALLASSAWASAGRSKRFWILLQLLLPYAGAVIYFAGVRPDVRFFSVPPSPDWQPTAGQ